MTIKIQSFIDVITNSSSCVYQLANDSYRLKEFVNGILKVCNIEKTFDDIFTLKINYEVGFEEVIDKALDILDRENIEDKYLLNTISKYREETNKYWRDRDDWERKCLSEEIIKSAKSLGYPVQTANEYAEARNHDAYSDDRIYSSKYEIRPKDSSIDKYDKVLDYINQLFEYGEYYDG